MLLLGSLFFGDELKVSYISYIYLTVAILFIIGLIIYELHNKLKIIYIIINVICAVLCFILGAERHYDYFETKEYFDNITEGGNITFQGRLTLKEKKTASYYLYFNDIIIDDTNIDSNISIILVSDSDDIPLDAIAIIEGAKLQFNRARNEGNFDEQSYYNSLGVVCKVKGDIVNVYESSFSLQEMLYEFRNQVVSVLESNLPGEESGIMSAMSLGDKSDLDTETKDLFKLSGLAHILAISGLHISIVGMGIYRLLRRRGVNFLISGIIASVIVILYGMMVDGGVSTIRAVGMLLIMIIANILGESYDMLTAVGVLVMYVLILYPYCIYSVGFIFSFGTVTGIAVIVSPLSGVYDKYIRAKYMVMHKGEAFHISIKERLVKALLGGILIQSVTLPIVCYYYFEIPLYVIFLNMIVIPLLGVLLSVTLLGGLFGVVAGVITSIGVVAVGSIINFLGEMLLYIAHFIIYAYEFLAYNSLKLPLARIITGRPSLVEILLYYVVLFLITKYILHKSRDMDKFIKSDFVSYRRRLIGCIAGFVLMVLCITNNDNRLAFEMDMLDVGQGDGIYIGGGSVNYFFDGGSTSVNNVGTYRILPFLKYKGIRKIEYWFISHTDSDHTSGLIEALEAGYNIDYIVVDEYMIGSSGYDIIKSLADENGTEILIMNKGDVIENGDFTLECIFAGDDSIGDINANSLVLLGEYEKREPVTILIGGDMTAASEKLIMADKSVALPEVDILKVAHHGSKTSSSPEFIEAIQPKLSLISAGVNNSYGHPHDVTLNTLENVNSEIYRTDENGRLLVDLSVKKVAGFL